MVGKAEGVVIKCLRSLPLETSWKNVKAVLNQQFFLVPTVMHAATKLIHQYEQKGHNLQEFSFKVGEPIQTVSNHEPKDIKDLQKFVCTEKCLTSQ